MGGGNKCFEGWYFKHQIGERVFAFIVSFQIDKYKKESAYVQFITNEGSYGQSFPMEECSVNTDSFYIKIGNNRFGKEGCRVRMIFPDMEVACNVKYGAFTELKTDIMGPFASLPKMECKHRIYSMNHEIRGFIDINGEATELSGGTGYIEGDIGESFPKSYMWTQCNFKYKGEHSIMLASGDVPTFWGHFEGIICQILYRDKQYRLATYLGAKVIQKSRRSIGIQQGNMRVYVQALEEAGFPMKAPEKGELVGTIYENPAGRVRYIFYKDEKKIFDFISRCGSFESHNVKMEKRLEKKRKHKKEHIETEKIEEI